MATGVDLECVFFFSSRRRHTRCGRDWSSDVCSSDLTTGERGVDDVGRREPVVHPAAFRSELLGDGVDERREIVVGRLLDFAYALYRWRDGVRTDGGHIVSRHGADFGPAVEGRQLDVEPAGELPLLRPDPAHRR